MNIFIPDNFSDSLSSTLKQMPIYMQILETQREDHEKQMQREREMHEMRMESNRMFYDLCKLQYDNLWKW